jgi:peptidoglycan/LPS O-acetylase OafA/YrhL
MIALLTRLSCEPQVFIYQQWFNMVKYAEVTGSQATIPRQSGQFGLVNLLKAVAAQLIVLHHLAFYGPMTDSARQLVPATIDWLDQYGRIAVQVFLVIGGFLAAKSLAPGGRPVIVNPLQAAWRRYIKLAPPFMAAMLLAVFASAVARHWMDHDSISGPASLRQLGAHLLLLHDVLGFEALSAGVWYVAIDFQLYALATLIVWTCGLLAARTRAGAAKAWLLPVVVALGVCASLLYFNRNADWDVYAPYFFGSYGLGVLAWWASDPKRNPLGVTALLFMMVVPTMLALVLEFRSRIAVAMVVACLLMLFGRTRSPSGARQGWAVSDYLGKISYSIFLVHFPVCLVVNAAFTRFMPDEPLVQSAGALLAWAASVAAGATFHHLVEAPLARWLPGIVKPVAVAPVVPEPVRLRG